MDTDRLFLADLGWLDQLVRSGSSGHHDWLLASGRLRLLLLDGTPLMDVVNRSRRLHIRFEVVPAPPAAFGATPVIWGTPHGLSPDFLPPGARTQVVSLKRDAFLRERVMGHMGFDLTVKDLIKHAANVSGGVHAGAPSTPAERRLDEIADDVFVNDLPMAIACLHGIAAVSVKALSPLADAIVTGA